MTTLRVPDNAVWEHTKSSGMEKIGSCKITDYERGNTGKEVSKIAFLLSTLDLAYQRKLVNMVVGDM
jgi:hypothetical protein